MADELPGIRWPAWHAALAQRFGARIAVSDAAGSIRFDALIAQAAGIGTTLLAAGVRPGEPVATLLRNGRFAVAGGWGVLFAGAADTPLNIAYTEAECATALGIAGVRHVVCGREHAAFFRDLGATAHVVEDISATPLDPARFPAVAPAAFARIQFTSGTTGLPKAVVATHRARLAGHVLLRASLPWLPSSGERILLMSPFAHGASLQTYAWLDHGGEVVLHDGVDPARILPLLESRSLAAIFAAPTVLAKLTAAFAGRTFAGIRTIFTGTAPLPAALYARVREMFGPVVRITYGKTEVINPITILTPPETDAFYAAGGSDDGSACVGWPATGVELAIDEANDGEVLIRAQHMSAGTLAPDGTVTPWRADGFHPTGDVGRIDDAGRLHLLARLGDAMKTGGYKVYPQEVERVLGGIGAEVVVVGIPSPYWGEVIAAVAENPRPGWEDAARAACAGLSPFKRPRLHLAVAALPRNGQGKVVRRHLLTAIAARWRLDDGPHPRLMEIA
jgi:acyl-CoA synthetase (AMP-forming)/AMP-acid ligase II